MSNFDIRRLILIMEFFYGFLFGVAVFGATLTFLLVSSFVPAILFAVCVFAFFMFLIVIIRYCIARVKISYDILESTRKSIALQEKILETKYLESDLTDNKHRDAV